MGLSITELPGTSNLTPQDLLPVHDYESNTTKKIAARSLQNNVHRFEPIFITDTAVTLSPEHETAMLVFTSAGSTTVSIDDNVFELGCTIHLLRDDGAGPVTVQALGGSTVVLRPPEGKLSQARGTNSPMTVYLKEKGASEYWNIWGDLKDQ